MAPPGLIEKFGAAGGRFIVSADELQQKIAQCNAVVFDWDGVFNTGSKGSSAQSGFSEPDSMGTNMLRYGLWRRLGRLPFTAIISGADNDSAIAFARREHLTAVYTGMHDKKQVIEHICDEHALQPDRIACVFDDINDLPMAGACGLRFRVRRDASPLFAELADDGGYCDYVTGAESSGYAVREVCELVLGLMGTYAEVVESRVARDDDYERYFAARQSVVTDRYSQQQLTIVRDGATT